MSEVLDQFQEAQNQAIQRMRELEPLVREYEELRRVVGQLDGAPSANRPRSNPSRSEGGRRHDIQRIVAETPGVTINQLGKTLGVDPTGLYRPVRALVSDGLIHKQGPNLYPQTVTSLRPGVSMASAAWAAGARYAQARRPLPQRGSRGRSASAPA